MSDYDSLWKEVLERYFAAFTAFFFPAVHAGIDWERGYAFLDNSKRRTRPATRTRATPGSGGWRAVSTTGAGRAKMCSNSSGFWIGCWYCRRRRKSGYGRNCNNTRSNRSCVM
jgi:hypothetical protein